MAQKDFYVHVDMNQNQLLQVVIENLGTPPTTPVVGQLYYDNLTTDNGKLFLWNGAWIDLTKQGVVDGDYGDITVTSSGTVWTIDDDVVTYAKMQNTVGANVILGSTAAGGIISELTATQVRAILNVADGATVYNDEAAQDAIGTILVDSTTIDFTYNDTTPSITAIVIDDSITYAKLQNAVANNVFLANNNGAGTAFEEITGTQATAMLDTFTSTLKGLVPGSGGGTSNWLRADGTWATIPAGFAGFTITGDSGSGAVNSGDTVAFTTGAGLTTATSKASTTVTTTINIDTAGVTNAMLATMAAYTVKSNNTSGAASPTDVAIAANSVLGRVAAGIVSIAIDSDLSSVSASHDTIPSALAVKNAIGTAVTNGMKYLGSFDPTASAGAGLPNLKTITSAVGDTYTVTVAGTYNWTTGSAVLEIGDTLIAEEAGVLSNVNQWTILNKNLDGVVIGPTSAVDNRVVLFDGTSGKLIKDSGLTLSGSNTGDEANASTTVKGIAEEATSAEAVAGTASGGTGARLFVNPGSLNSVLGVNTPVLNPAVGTISNARVYRQTIGDTAATSIAVTHGLNSESVLAQVWRAAGNMDLVECEVRRTSSTVTTFIFNVAPALNEFLVVITG